MEVGVQPNGTTEISLTKLEEDIPTATKCHV